MRMSRKGFKALANEDRVILRRRQGLFCEGAEIADILGIVRNCRRPMPVERITVDPNIHFGKPCVAGTRITVRDVLELLAEGLSVSEIIRDYCPDLVVEGIRACLRYAIAVIQAEDIQLAAA